MFCCDVLFVCLLLWEKAAERQKTCSCLCCCFVCSFCCISIDSLIALLLLWGKAAENQNNVSCVLVFCVLLFVAFYCFPFYIIAFLGRNGKATLFMCFCVFEPFVFLFIVCFNDNVKATEKHNKFG